MSLHTDTKWLDVRAYGATGDGATNDYASIAAAIAAAPATGAVIWFPRGVYLTNSVIDVTKSDLTFLFEDWGSVVRLGAAAASGTRVFNVTGNRVRFVGGYIDGNYSARGAVAGAAILFNGCTGGEVSRCRVVSSGFDTIGAWNATDLAILNNRLTGGTDSGVDLVEGTNKVRVIGNYIEATADTRFPVACDTADTVTYGYVADIVVQGNTVVCGANNSQGISFETVKRCLANGNTVYVPTIGRGIKVFAEATDCIVSDNLVRLADVGATELLGIEVNDQDSLQDKTTTTVIGNVVRSDSVTGNVGYQVYQTGCNVRGNLAMACRYGYRIDSNNTVKDCVLDGNQANGCTENFRHGGAYANKSRIRLRGNVSLNPGSYDYTFDTGYDIVEYRGAYLDTLTVFGANAVRIRGDYRRTAIPTAGTWSVGDVIYNSTPTAGGVVGWACVTAGTPGTWNAFYAVDASAKLPAAILTEVLATSDLTDLSGAVNAANGTVKLDAGAKVPLAQISEVLATSDLTDLSGAVNTANGTVKLDANAEVPQAPARSLYGLPSTRSVSDNTTYTPSATRPTHVTLQIQFASAVAGDDTSFAVTVGAHTFGLSLRAKNETTAGSVTKTQSIAFIVPANTTYKVAKTNNSGTPTITYSAEETTL